MDDNKFMAAIGYITQGDYLNAAEVFESEVDPGLVAMLDENTVWDESVQMSTVNADLVAVLSGARGEFIEHKGFGDHESLTAFFVALAKKAAKC